MWRSPEHLKRGNRGGGEKSNDDHGWVSGQLKKNGNPEKLVITEKEKKKKQGPSSKGKKKNKKGKRERFVSRQKRYLIPERW